MIQSSQQVWSAAWVAKFVWIRFGGPAQRARSVDGWALAKPESAVHHAKLESDKFGDGARDQFSGLIESCTRLKFSITGTHFNALSTVMIYSLLNKEFCIPDKKDNKLSSSYHLKSSVHLRVLRRTHSLGLRQTEEDERRWSVPRNPNLRHSMLDSSLGNLSSNPLRLCTALQHKSAKTGTKWFRHSYQLSNFAYSLFERTCQ